jgi:hypothetical protein
MKGTNEMELRDDVIQLFLALREDVIGLSQPQADRYVT